MVGFVDYFLDVPDGVGALEVRLENHDSANNIDLLVRFGDPVDVTEEGRVLADCVGAEPEGIEVCVITPEPPSSLPAGFYFIKVANHESERQRFTLTATLLSQPPGPVIEVDRDRLEFHAQASGENPVPQTLRITAEGGALTWTAEEDISWLTLEPREGALNDGQTQEITISVDISGLQPGQYEGQITITSPEAVNSPPPVTVTLELSPGPILEVCQDELRFEARVGGPDPEPQALEITNEGGGILAWRARWDADWLRVDPVRGVLAASQTQTASVSVDITGLEPGIYEATIEFTSELQDPENVRDTVDVRLVILPLPGEVLVLKFVQLEFLRPQDWERRLQEGCVIYKNIGTEPSPIRATLPDETVLEFQIPVGNEVIICGDVVHIDTRVPPPEG